MLIFYLFICTQVVLESFPVSSSGHCALLQLIMHTSHDTHALGTVYHLLHGISALIIAVFFVRDWMPLLMHMRRCLHQIMRVLLYVGIADSITGCFFIFMHYSDRSWFPLGLGFAITAAALASLYWCKQSSYKSYAWYHAVILGIVQGCALLPGISRFGLTYVVGRWLRLSPYKAFQMSFAIEWPLIAAASLVSIPLLANPYVREQFLNPYTLLVILISGGSAWGGLALVAYLVRTERLWMFALYMILPLLVWLIHVCA